MATGTIFPAFLRLEHQDDGSGKASFLRTVDQTLGSAEDRFKAFSGEAKRQLDAALSASRTAGGSLDLGAGPARAAAEAAKARAIAAREIANATSIAARAEGDYSQSARLSIAAATALAVEEEQAARAALDHAKAIEQVQAVLSRQASATNAVLIGGRRLVAANDAGAVSAGQYRAGMQQLSYQLGDVGIGLSMAAQASDPVKMAFMTLGQQTGQVVQAITLMRGEAKGLVGFLAGPWGAAAIAATSVLGPMIANLIGVGAAAGEAKSGLDQIKLSSFGLNEAQSALGGVFDMTTGKMTVQTGAALALAKAQLILAKATAQKNLADARSTISGSAAKQWEIGGGMGGGISIGRTTPITAQVESQFRNGVIDANGAIESLRRMHQAGRISTETFAQLSAAYANAGVETQNLKTLGQAEASLLTGRLNPALRETTKNHRSHRDAMTAGEKAAKAYARALESVAAAHDEMNKRGAWGSSTLAGRVETMARDTDPAKLIGAPANDNPVTVFQQIAATNAEALKPLAASLQTWNERMDAARAAGAGSVMAMAPEAFFANLARAMGPLADQIGEVLGPAFVGKLGGVLEGAVRGEASGGIPGGVIGALKGIEGLPAGLSKALGKAGAGAATGSAIAGLSNALGLKMNTTGAQLGGAIGSVAGPIGSIVGSVAGGLLGNLFKSVKSGYAQVRNGVVAGTYGRTGDLQTQAAEAANGLIDQFKTIADKLGANLGKFGFDIGSKDGKFAFTPGAGPGAGVTQWYDKEADALSAALRSVVANGAFEGISDGVKRLISTGDIQTQLQKALDFQGVFKRLKSYTDPVGAALEDLNSEFGKLKTTFAEAGASAAEYSKLEQLYGLERAKAIKAAMAQVTGDLQGLLDDLGVGNSARSLREREGLAKAALDPLAARVAAGDTTAFADFSSASRTLIDISRQIYGSQDAFFAVQDGIAAQAKAALDKQQAIADAATSRDSPFATSTPTSDNDRVEAAIRDQTDALLAAQMGANDNLAAILLALRSQSAGGTVLSSAAGYW